MKSHYEKGGEDNIGEEGDEVNHFPIRLTVIKIVIWIVHISSSREAKVNHFPIKVPTIKIVLQ